MAKRRLSGHLGTRSYRLLAGRLKHVSSPLLGACVGLAIGALALALAATPFGVAWQERLDLAWLFRLRGPVSPPPNVVIVGLDKKSADALDLSTRPGEWPRALHARLIDALTARGARLIAFDISFTSRRDEEGDRRLAQAIARSGRVILLEQLERSRHSPANSRTEPGSGLWIEERRKPLPMFSDAALGTAPFPLPKNSDRIDWFWAFLDRYGGLPTLPALAAQLAAGDDADLLLQALRTASVTNAETHDGVAAGGARVPPPVEVGRALRHLFQAQPELLANLPSGGASKGAPVSISRALIGLYAGPDTRYLNYYGPPGTIRTISHYALIADNAGSNPEGTIDFSGAYVFGGYAELQGPTKTDTFVTVFPGRDGIEMSGVEIAATAFANLLSDRTLKRPGPGITVAVLLGIGTLATVITCWLPAAIGIATAFGLALAYGGAACLMFARYDLWLPLAIPNVVELPLAVVLGLFTQYLRARTQRRAMQNVVSLYVPERVVHEMADHVVNPLSVHETTFATCLAMDAENFTAVSETLPPEAMAAYLNDYFAAVAEPLARYSVDFKEFHADSVMCAWMSSGADVLIRTRACHAALETLNAVHDFNARRAPLRLGVRLGLHAGHVFVGNVGAGGQFSFRILGDIVNTACRVEGLNKFVATRVLATRDVIADVEGLLLRPLGDFQLKGKRTAVSIFEIVAHVERARDDQRALCERFAAALDVFQTWHRKDAAALFAAILQDYPSDGPTHFYVQQCQSRQDGDVNGGNDSIIRVEDK